MPFCSSSLAFICNTKIGHEGDAESDARKVNQEIVAAKFDCGGKLERVFQKEIM